MPANQNQFSQEDSGISRLTGDESDSGGVLGNSRNNAARNLRPPASSGIVVRRRLRSTHFDHAANGALDRAADKFVVGKHLSCGDVVSEFDHVTSGEPLGMLSNLRHTLAYVHRQAGSIRGRRPVYLAVVSLRKTRFSAAVAAPATGGGASDAAHPSSNLSPTDGHVTSETTLTLDRSGGDVVPPPSTILRAQSARENCFENTPNLHTNYDNMTQMNRSVKLDLMNLRKEMADMQMECDRLIEAGEFFERRRKEEREKRMLGKLTNMITILSFKVRISKIKLISFLIDLII
uniref:Uncharacterized protein n=1 Tax=Romanomermis culicivorax TaxID=13658 RepID=A0A915I5H9_ROMCU